MSVDSPSGEGGPEEEEPSSPLLLGSIVVGLAIVLSLGLGELLLRIAWENPFVDEKSDWFIEIETHPPFRKLGIDRAAIDPDEPVAMLRTDDRGYILPGRRFADPDATIAFLGGSTTQNSAVKEEIRFPALVSTLLEEKGQRVNVLNAGKSGTNTHDHLNTLLNHVVEDDPDVVVQMEAHNDVGMLAGRGAYRPRGASRLNASKVSTWLLQWGSTHSSLAGALRKWLTIRPVRAIEFKRAGSELERKELPYHEYEHRLRAFVGICRSFGIVPVLMTQPSIAMRTKLTPNWTDLQNQERFNEIIRRVAADEGVLLVDLVAHLSAEVPDWKEPNRIFYDGVHVNDAGSEILARHIAQRLQPLVEQIRTASSR